MQIDLADIQHWLFEEALPFWALHGKDHVHGGPVEEVALDGGLSSEGFKRVRVFCRQVYVFSHAHLMGWEAGKAHADDMYDAMVAHAWQGPKLGWAKTVTDANSILNPTTDLYDNAFALYALGWYYRIAPRADVLALMLETANLIDTLLRHPLRGFWHQWPVAGPRIQNPHMHLLEACLACFESTKEPIFERLAREVIGLFNDHFFNHDQMTLCEYFNDDLSPLAGDKGLIVEPGHQFEWAWILANASKMFGLDVCAQARSLVAYGERHGVDPASHATYNSHYSDGRVLDHGSRTWPNTERLKAAVAMHDLFGEDTSVQINQTIDLLFNRYLSNCPKGGWIDAFDAAGNPVARAMPTSTFYHIYLAFAEVVRVGEGASAASRE